MYAIELVLLVSAFLSGAASVHHLKDINQISKYWGHLRHYTESPEDIFGINHTGLPAGCQIETVQVLQRHAERFPTTYYDDGGNTKRFFHKLSNYTSVHSSNSFHGLLSFLNTWKYIFNEGESLTGPGSASQVAVGVDFWNHYGRFLFNASTGQTAYDPKFPNGTARPPIIMRTTDQSRMIESLKNWAHGFFGLGRVSYVNETELYKIVILPEESKVKWNNTLASYISCPNFLRPEIGYMGERLLEKYIPRYLVEATERLQEFAPHGFRLTTQDMHAMQLLCAYETAYIGSSEFCGLFTNDEWEGFENSLDLKYYYSYCFGNPTGRAQGIGYVEEMFARFNHSLMYSSSSSVNSTMNSNPETFPTNQPLYMDFTHDDIIISTLAALSIDYFRTPLSTTQYPPDPNRKFILSQVSPFSSNLVTETIGCSSPDPRPRKSPLVYYSLEQDGYDPSKAIYKFVRMRLNRGIVPLNTVRHGACGDEFTGRVDGMCALENLMKTRENLTALADYQYACFSNYSTDHLNPGHDYDGKIS